MKTMNKASLDCMRMKLENIYKTCETCEGDYMSQGSSFSSCFSCRAQSLATWLTLKC